MDICNFEKVDLEIYMTNKIEKLITDKTFLSSMIIGFITYIPVAMYTHLAFDTYTFFNNPLNKIHLLSYSRPFRYVLENLSKVINTLTISPNFAVISSVFLLAISIYLLSVIFDIKNGFIKILLGFSITLPVFNDYFNYLHDVIAYSLVYFLTTLSCYIVLCMKMKYKYIISYILFAISFLTYQPVAQIASSVFVIYLIYDLIIRNKNANVVLVNGIKLGSLFLLSCLSYILIAKLSGGSGLIINKNYLISLFKIYAMPFSWIIRRHVDVNISILQKVSIAVIYIYTFVTIFKRLLNLKAAEKVLCLLLILIFPLVTNFSYFAFAGGTNRYVIGMVYLVLIPCILLDNFYDTNSLIKNIVVIAIIVECTMCIFYESVKTYRQKLIEDSLQSYVTELVSSIKMTEGYKSTDKICLVGKNGINHFGNTADYWDYKNPYNIDTYDHIFASREPYNYELLIRLKGGFNLNLVSENERESITSEIDIDSIPVYPDYGSIIRKNETIIVRMN